MSQLACLIQTFSNTLLKPHIFHIHSARGLRGKAPEVARSLKERLIEIQKDAHDPSLFYKVNIGLPFQKPSRSEEYFKRKKVLRSHVESQPVTNKPIPLNEIRREWLKTSAPHQLRKLAEHFNVFQDLFGDAYFVPRIPLAIHYHQADGSSIPVYYGNQIKPCEASQPPTVTFEADASSLWSLVLTNPDGHFHKSDSEYLHWFVGNIPGNDIGKGEQIMSYLQPFPPKGTGSQRLIFVLFKQEQQIDFSELQRSAPCLCLAERTFQMWKFYEQFQSLLTPAGLAFYQSDWDKSLTDFFHKTLDMKEPIYEFDFPQPYKKAPVWFPKKKAFNLYLDHHRDPKQIAKELLVKRLKTVDPFKPKDPEPKYPNAFPEDTSTPSWQRVEIRKQRLKWGRYADA